LRLRAAGKGLTRSTILVIRRLTCRVMSATAPGPRRAATGPVATPRRSPFMPPRCASPNRSRNRFSGGRSTAASRLKASPAAEVSARALDTRRTREPRCGLLLRRHFAPCPDARGGILLFEERTCAGYIPGPARPVLNQSSTAHRMRPMIGSGQVPSQIRISVSPTNALAPASPASTRAGACAADGV
jgi:hypothetical protein